MERDTRRERERGLEDEETRGTEEGSERARDDSRSSTRSRAVLVFRARIRRLLRVGSRLRRRLSQVARVPRSAVSARRRGQFGRREDRLVAELTVSSHDPGSVRGDSVHNDEHENGSGHEDRRVRRQLRNVEDGRSVRVGRERRVAKVERRKSASYSGQDPS